MNPTILLTASCNPQNEGVLEAACSTSDAGAGSNGQALGVQLYDAITDAPVGDPQGSEQFTYTFTFQPIANGTYYVILTDLDGETARSLEVEVSCTTSGGGPGGGGAFPPGVQLADYCSADLVGRRVRLFFDVATRATATDLSDDATCTPGQGEPVDQAILFDDCDGTTKLIVRYQRPDQAVLTETPNSTACGYTPPGGGGGGGTDPDPDPDPTPGPEPDSQWGSLWAPEGIPVTAEPAGPDAPAFVAADLYAGFPAGHPLAADRPLTFVAALRATVAPSGVAMFNLAPYLRSEVGALLPSGSRRLDYNSATALTEDLYVGYSLTRGGVTLARGYALNGVLSEQQLSAWPAGRPLTPFGGVVPVWPGYSFASPQRTATGVVPVEPSASGQRLVHLPCPRYGLPVVWLSPEGGYGYWVFSGQPAYGDDVGEGQPYIEAGTQELRYSSRAASRATVEAYSGVFSERAFVEGLRTLRRAVQAWYQPEADGPWVPIVLKGGAFPAYREGRRRYEATVQFSEAKAIAVQGQ
ncbi:hypothetical protein [Hymenobacter glacieicola]|uniref:Uncharacterized protein n=1 Tax=Hymenobacter glacieicola TaxID=1562124 RepID=A0ABQ1WKL1_9BACT|nr:hypothetical protein [Hymenobacter glacieicola]GGG34153.1 hypothetical protein GCM10011378_08210 [Hymenobacter glacieicola]